MMKMTDTFFDYMIEKNQEAEEKAEARIYPWQADLEPGQFAVRYRAGIPIFSEILPYPDDVSEHHKKNYVFTRSYSSVCPDGELGDVHRSTFEYYIGQKFFERVKARNWRL